jgi:hypothetical protein
MAPAPPIKPIPKRHKKTIDPALPYLFILVSPPASAASTLD